ncbi:MAG: hypothetical protein WD960_01485 [Gemmatimonadota bacterium]
MTASGWMRVVPPFLLGAALSVAAIVAAGLLLYGGPGFIQALGVLLAILLGALAAGVAAGQAGRTTEPVEALRRRWLLTLLSFTLAAAFSAGWEAFRGFGALPLTQAVGLALLGGLPLFAGGSVLGFLGRPADLPGGIRGPAVPALAGSAAGALLLGFVLFPALSPTGTLLTCLVTLSLAALVQGRVLDEVTWVRGSEEVAEESDDVAVEWWSRGQPQLLQLALLEGEHLRMVAREGGAPVRPQDLALREGIHRWVRPGGQRVLALGVGMAPLLRSVAEESAAHNDAERHDLILVDENAALLKAVGDHLLNSDALQRRVELRRRSVREVLAGSPAHLPPESWDLILIDTLSLALRPGRFELPAGAVLNLRAALRRGGALVVGPMQDGGRPGSLLDTATAMAAHFPRVSLYVSGRSIVSEPEGVPLSRVESWHRSEVDPGSRPAFLVAARGKLTEWPDRVGGYLRVLIGEPGEAQEGGRGVEG